MSEPRFVVKVEWQGHFRWHWYVIRSPWRPFLSSLDRDPEGFAWTQRGASRAASRAIKNEMLTRKRRYSFDVEARDD
jgi:hypothetical protein